MRFEIRTTSDGSATVYDSEAGECYKSRHAARSESEAVFIAPGVRENPWFGKAAPFRVLELGFGLGTNFSALRESGLPLEFHSIERDLAGAEFFLQHFAQPELAEILREKIFSRGGFSAQLHVGDFFEVMPRLEKAGFHAIFFDPFSPKANPEAWTQQLFQQAADLLAPGGRLVTYSVSRAAKDAAAAAGLTVAKRDLPANLQKRSALLATKPPSP